MENRLNKTTELYLSEFKNSIRNKSIEIDFQDKSKINELIEFIFEYKRLVFTKEDLTKRKRVKNAIPVINRCKAIRASGEQCTRRKSDQCDFCGTHSKGIPHGMIMNTNEPQEIMPDKCMVIAREIKGIIYYIDNQCNVFDTEDIINNIVNPAIIAKCVIDPDGKYTIPAFGLI